MRGLEGYRVRLHDMERPIAQQTALTANQNRDAKKKKQPYTMLDFCVYKPLHAEDLPSGHYGAAALLMVKKGTFPSWALFCFKELQAQATQGYEPALPAIVAEDAVLLHPVESEGGFKGMLIALESASEQVRQFETPNGPVLLGVPHVHTKAIAEEDVVLLRP